MHEHLNFLSMILDGNGCTTVIIWFNYKDNTNYNSLSGHNVRLYGRIYFCVCIYIYIDLTFGVFCPSSLEGKTIPFRYQIRLHVLLSSCPIALPGSSSPPIKYLGIKQEQNTKGDDCSLQYNDRRNWEAAASAPAASSQPPGQHH